MAAKFTRFSEKRDTTGTDCSSYDDPVEGVEPDESAGLHIHLPEKNMGFVLMQKMGWSLGVGLGKDEQGRTDPVPLELKGDNMGLGRFQMELDIAAEATEKRKQLEIEKELTPGLIDKYKAQVEKEQAIADSTSDLRKSYKCELCDKQYSKYLEYDNHLNSYDHHHRQRLKDLRQYEAGRRFGSHKSVGEIQEKKASMKAVAKERAQMKVERYYQQIEGGDAPGFKPIGLQRRRSSKQDKKDEPIESKVAINSALRKKNEEEIAQSELKIANKKARLAKYGVKFESAGHLETINSKSSYQEMILSTPIPDVPVTTSSSSSSNSSLLYGGQFVPANSSNVVEDLTDDSAEREKRLSELPTASGRKAEHLAAVEAAVDSSEGSDDEDFTVKKRKMTISKRTNTTKQMSLKLTGDKYESYYY